MNPLKQSAMLRRDRLDVLENRVVQGCSGLGWVVLEASSPSNA